MKKIIVLAMLALLVMPVVSFPVFAQAISQVAVTDAGNKLCPISGGPVIGNDFVTYQGVRYGICCPGCDKTFLANPEKYLAKMKEKEPAVFQTALAKEQGSEHPHQEHPHQEHPQ